MRVKDYFGQNRVKFVIIDPLDGIGDTIFMMLQINDKVLIASRPIGENQKKEFFIGAVVEFSAGLVKVTGVSWRIDSVTQAFTPKKTILTQIFSLNSGLYDCYSLPHSIKLNQVQFEQSQSGEVFIKDQKDFALDITFQ